jgi:hypothetical protein
MNKKAIAVAVSSVFVGACGNFHEDGDANKPEIGAPARAAQIVAQSTNKGVEYLNRPDVQQSIHDGAAKATEATLRTTGSILSGAVDGVKKLTDDNPQPAPPAQ